MLTRGRWAALACVAFCVAAAPAGADPAARAGEGAAGPAPVVFSEALPWGNTPAESPAPAPKPAAPTPAAPQPAVPPPKAALADEDVVRAIARGKEYLINQQNPDGSFSRGQAGGMQGCYSALIFMALAYLGEHLNHEVMEKAFRYVTTLNPDRDMAGRQGYALPIRAMGLCYVCRKNLSEKKEEAIRTLLKADIARLVTSQQRDGGWRYALSPTEDFDFSVTQWGILAIREASLLRIEPPPDCLRKALALYERGQNRDHGWGYQINASGTGSTIAMTSAGLASLYILSDVLEPAGACPCGRSRSAAALEIDRRIDTALGWVEGFYQRAGQGAVGGWGHYGLYCSERVGIAAGYKLLGGHNWYREGAEYLVKTQLENGSWGSIENTCFALLFLYKGRAPVLFNKLRFLPLAKNESEQDAWNAHRRDMAKLTHHVERDKEQPFHWQIVDLAAPLEELHDAPVLYITANAVPNFTKADAAKLRAFTDTGGTILFEASCGNPAVRRWFEKFAPEVWPEWPLVKLPKEHPVFAYPKPLPPDKLPEVLGIDDGLRTILYYSPDDVSCHWQTGAVASKEYLFNWGINVYMCARDGAPVRAKLESHEPPASGRYHDPVKAGPQTVVRVARVQYSGNWEVGANYGAFKPLAKRVEDKAGVTLEVYEKTSPSVKSGGVAPADLKGYAAAYLAGSREFTLAEADKAGLKAYAEASGFLWVEAAGGSKAFARSFAAAVQEMGWELKLLEKTHPLITGRMDPAVGYDLTRNLEFRRVLRFSKTIEYAEFEGVYAGGKLVGIFSPRDIVFSTTPYEACGCRGYKAEDAAAVATNIVLYLTANH